HSNSRRSLGDIRPTVPKRLPGTHFAQGKNSSLPGKDWLHRKREAASANGATCAFKWQVITIECQPGTHHGVPTFMMRDHGRSICRVYMLRIETEFAQHAACIFKLFELL